MIELTILALAALSFLLTLIICSRAEAIGRRLHVIDYPDVTGGRKRHNRPTPLVGGVAILASFIALSIAYALIMRPDEVLSGHLLIIFALVLGFGLMGYIDDRQELSPKIRLFALLIMVGLAILSQPVLSIQFLHFEFLPNAFILGAWGGVFTAVALVGLANAVNMADGKNGLVLGMCLIWNTVLLVFAPPLLLPYLAITLAAVAVTFVFNMRGLLFLGDTGSFALSAIFGLAAIYSYNQNFISIPADVVMLMFLVPVLDCLRLMISRVLRGSSPFAAGRDHLHHHLAANLGWALGLPLYLGLIAVPLGLRLVWPDLAFLAVCLSAGGYAVTLAAFSLGTKLWMQNAGS